MKKIFMLLVVLTFALQGIMAQSMTDEQITDFIITEQQRGADQRTIASKLLQKGVSVERLRRLKKKYDAEQEQLGAVDLTGKSKSASRLRKKELTKEEKSAMRNNNMMQSKRLENLQLTNSEKRKIYEEEIEFLDIDSVLYYKNLLKDETEVFGRNIFNNEFLTFEPALNIPIPPGYVLGAGDQILIDVWGASQTLVEGEISPDGNVVVEGVGPIYLAGLTVAEANKHVKNILGEIYGGSNVNLTVGAVRSVQVQVTGEVVAPGNYTLSALSTAFNALYAAGGVSELGTLRAINVYRRGKLISTIDVYDYILNGNTQTDVRLEDNDVVSVGAYDAIVNIQGKVKRPMLYELKSDETLSRLMLYSGSFSGDAYKENIRVVRKSGREYSIFTVGRSEFATFAMCDGDSVYVDSVIPRYSNLVEISGAVFYPGQYQFSEKINTVAALIEAAGGLREDAFLNRAVMHHRNYDNTIEAQALNIKGIMDGTVPDVPLRNNDAVFIPSKSEMEGEMTLKVGGEVRFEGVYKYAENTTIEDLILQAGGLTRAASSVKVDVFRQLYDPMAKEESENTSETYSFELKDGFVVDGDPDFVLMPFDEVYVRRSPIYTDKQNVTINGAVNFSGDYAIVRKDYKLSDLVEAAGGLSLSAYSKGAYLYRKMTEEELAQRETLLNSSQIELYEEALRSDKAMDLALLDSLYKAKLNMSDYYPVAINLESALKNPGGLDDMLLREGDIITVPQYTSTVKISGEVRHPISINWQEGKKLSYYIEHAGGYSDAAKKNGVYAIYMNGNVEKISKNSKKAIQPGCEIVVPRKQERRLSTAEIMTMGTSAISIATMIVSLINVLK
ncbi:MAG: SLBB domain-containing protein [Bacteroidaceae bacterium]|nr:SLBB domain-containing protein [Bacteroidaceae bacterium]